MERQLNLDDNRFEQPATLTPKQKRIVNLLSCDCTASTIADRLNISRAYVSQTIKILEKNNLVKKKFEAKYNAIYEVCPNLREQITDSDITLYTPCRVHNVAMKFHILQQAIPSKDKRTGYLKEWNMRGGTRYAFWYPGHAGEPSITAHLHPRTLVIRMDKGQRIVAETIEEAEFKGYQYLVITRQKFIDAQRKYGVTFDIEQTGTVISRTHYGYVFPKVAPYADTKTMIPGWHIDNSPESLGMPGYAEFETAEKQLAGPFDKAVMKVLNIDNNVRETITSTIPEAMNAFNKKIDPLDQKVNALMAMFQSGMTTQQVLNQTVALLGKTLDRMNYLEQKLNDIETNKK